MSRDIVHSSNLEVAHIRSRPLHRRRGESVAAHSAAILNVTSIPRSSTHVRESPLRLLNLERSGL